MPKTEMSRFPIHDDLTAPEGSLPILKGASSAAGQLPNLLGVLAGAPAALRAYTRFRAELRHGAAAAALRRADRARGRRALRLQAGSAAAHPHEPAGRLGIDEVARATALGLGGRRARRRCCATSARCSPTATFPQHLHEEAREAGWSDEQLLEAIAVLSMESFTAMVNVAGDVPVDGSVEETRVLRAA